VNSALIISGAADDNTPRCEPGLWSEKVYSRGIRRSFRGEKTTARGEGRVRARGCARREGVQDKTLNGENAIPLLKVPRRYGLNASASFLEPEKGANQVGGGAGKVCKGGL